jgi:hypothetical protein
MRTPTGRPPSHEIQLYNYRACAAAVRNSPRNYLLYDEAKKKSWTVISMKNDWKRILPLEWRLLAIVI